MNGEAGLAPAAARRRADSHKTAARRVQPGFRPVRLQDALAEAIGQRPRLRRARRRLRRLEVERPERPRLVGVGGRLGKALRQRRAVRIAAGIALEARPSLRVDAEGDLPDDLRVRRAAQSDKPRRGIRQADLDVSALLFGDDLLRAADLGQANQPAVRRAAGELGRHAAPVQEDVPVLPSAPAEVHAVRAALRPAGIGDHLATPAEEAPLRQRQPSLAAPDGKPAAVRVAVDDDERAAVIRDDDAVARDLAARDGLRCRQEPSLPVGVADRPHVLLRVARGRRERHEVGVHRVLRQEERRVPERERDGRPRLDDLPRRPLRHVCVAEEHARETAEVARQRMHPQQVEVHDPRMAHQLVRAILSVVLVGEARIEPLVPALGRDGAVPRLLLDQHDLAVGVERLGERARARHARVVVRAAPGRNGGMHVAVGRVEAEPALDDRRERLAHFHAVERLRGRAARPRELPVPVFRAGDAIRPPVAVDGREVGEVVVRPVAEAELVDQLARMVVLSLVAAASRRGMRPKGVALVAVAPARLVVGDDQPPHPLAAMPEQRLAVGRAVARRAGRDPSRAPRDGPPRRDGVRDER